MQNNPKEKKINQYETMTTKNAHKTAAKSLKMTKNRHMMTGNNHKQMKNEHKGI